MNKKIIISILEFLAGLIILPRLVLFVWVFVAPFFGGYAIIALLVLFLVLIIGTFFLRKILAIGFLAGAIVFWVLGI